MNAHKSNASTHHVSATNEKHTYTYIHTHTHTQAHVDNY
jgi:hypothetical protein